MTIVDINQAPASEELSATETLSISGGSWVSSSYHFAVGKAVESQSVLNFLPDFGGHFGLEACRAILHW